MEYFRSIPDGPPGVTWHELVVPIEYYDKLRPRPAAAGDFGRMVERVRGELPELPAALSAQVLQWC